MSSSDSSEASTFTRVRKPNSQLQDEPQFRFNEKGFRIRIEPAAPPEIPRTKKPPLPPKKTAEKPAAPPAAAPPPAAALVIPIAARDQLPPPDGTGPLAEATKPKRTQIQWNDERDEMLIDKVTALDPNDKRKLEDRFQDIADDLFKTEAFKNFTVVKGGTFQRRYTEMKKDALKRWAIDEEGANLSGLPEFDSSKLKGWEMKLYTILLREEKGAKGKAVTTVHGINREISMLTHEKEGLQRQLKGMKFLQGNSAEPIEIDSDYDWGEEEEENEGEEGEETEDGEPKVKKGGKKKKLDQKQLGKGVHKAARSVMSSTPRSNLSTNTGGTTTVEPYDDRLLQLLGRPKDPTPEEAAIALEERQLELRRKNWQLEKEQEEWELKKKRDEEEFELRKEERKAAAQKDTILLTLFANRENKEK